MTFLGLERPVEWAAQQTFNPAAASMVLSAQQNYANAVYNAYQDAKQDMKDFAKEYGDFMSPIQKDMEWYDKNVTGRVRDVINNMYANGIDPLRSAEGRAAVAQLIYSMPTGDIAKVRQSAEAAKEYIKNRGILEAAGKWDSDFERFANNGQMLEDWDTIGGDRVWNRTSPAELKTLKELTEPWYNQRTAHTLDKAGVESFGIQYDPRYDYAGFTNKDLLDIASGQTPGWNGSIYADYYRNIAKRQLQAAGVDNPTQNQIEAMLQRNVAIANKEYLINPTRSVNALYLQDLKNRQARAIASLRGRRVQGDPNNAPTTFMDRLQDNMGKSFERKYFSSENVGKTLNGIVDYWDKMAKSVEGKGKVIGQETYDAFEPGYNKSKVVGMGPYARLAYEDSVKKTKTRNVYDQSGNALFNKYNYEKNRWVNFANGKYEPSKYDKSEEAKLVRNILKKGRKATAEEMAFVQQYQQDDIMGMVYKANSSSPGWSGQGNQLRGTMATKDAKKRASAFWDTFSAEGLGPIQNKTLHQTFIGSNNTLKDPDLPNGQYTVRFGSGYHYAPVRQLNISGSARFKHNDIHSRFDRFLNGQYGVSMNENDVKAAGIPHVGRVGRQLDILSHPSISKEQLESFRSSLKDSKYKNMSIDDVARELGLRAVNQKITYRGKDEELHSTDTYYEVPVIRTVENLGGYNFRDINVLSDINEFNAGIADKNVINSENQSVTDDLPIELAISSLLQ